MKEIQDIMLDLKTYQQKLAFGMVSTVPESVSVALDWFEEQNQKREIPSSKVTRFVKSLRNRYCQKSK
jgi:hypothetical protein